MPAKQSKKLDPPTTSTQELASRANVPREQLDAILKAIALDLVAGRAVKLGFIGKLVPHTLAPRTLRTPFADGKRVGERRMVGFQTNRGFKNVLNQDADA